MTGTARKDQFKLLIREFHSQKLPETYGRDLAVPLSSKKIVTVYGPRRSGKSFYFYTLIQQLRKTGIDAERILYLNFEDDRILPLEASALQAVMEAYFELYPENKNREIYLFFDEIQNISGWEVFVRRIHDKEKVKLFLTGSSSKLLSRDIATSLRGRTISFALYPLSFREVLRFRNMEPERNFEYGPARFAVKKALEDYLEYGGFPEVILEKNELIRSKILEEYFESLVLRDLAERHGIENLTLLRDLIKFLFANMTLLFSVNSYYKAAKGSFPVSRQTIMDYLRIIQETGYLTLLAKFSWSLKERRVNPQKVLCVDQGVRNRLVFRFSKDVGRAAENVVGQALVRTGSQVFYWEEKREVDFVVQDRSGIRGINVTFGSVPPEREIEGLLEFRRRYKRVKDLLLITRDSQERRGIVKCVPLWKWLLG